MVPSPRTRVVDLRHGESVDQWLYGGCQEFALDEANWTVSHLNIYTTEDCQQSHFMGNAEQLWNGNRTLVLAMTAQVDEVTTDGDLVARWNAPLGSWLGFTSRLPDLGPIDSP